MIKNLLIVCLLITIAVFTKAQSPGQECRAPDNQTGICVRIRRCPSLLAMLRQPVVFQTNRDFVRQSQCGTRGDFVCCTDAATTTPPIRVSTTTTRRITTTTHRPTTTTRRTTTTTTRRPTTTTPSTQPRILSNRISAKKCDEYADFAYNKTYTVSPFGDYNVVRTSTCAATSIGLVYGGVEANRREFPHMALIGFFYENEVHWECGGTLISERFVLSADHCSWTKITGPAKYVRLGEHNIVETLDVIHMDFGIIDTISHANVSPTTYNDIVLFKLDRDVPFSHAIRPACLPQQTHVQRDVIATSWGTVPEGQRSNTLLKVVLRTFSREEWNRTSMGHLINKDYDEESMVFAGHNTEGRDMCDGDSGGPLQFRDQDRNHHCTYIVVGITSSGISCGRTGSPAIYTKVYSHLDWIEQTVWSNK